MIRSSRPLKIASLVLMGLLLPLLKASDDLRAPSSLPQIQEGPKDQNLIEGDTAFFSVTAAGEPPLTYQWKKDGVNIVGAWFNELKIPSAMRAEDGTKFTCAVTNFHGTIISPAATLTVAPKLSVLSAHDWPEGQPKRFYTFALEASGGTPPFSWSILKGNLPAGITLKPHGVISGTPSFSGTFTFTLGVRDASKLVPQSDQKMFTLVIKTGPEPKPEAARFQISPNPFSPGQGELTISNLSPHAELLIVDRFGRPMIKLSGNSTIRWNGHDNTGTPLESGAYTVIEMATLEKERLVILN